MTGRNIVIFSDGTGQRGGILVDENRSNIYKLYRATRVCPDTSVDPAEQLAFYDPGIGTLPPASTTLVRAWRWVYNLISQALGLGLTGNMVDCYAAIVRLWQPGDRIFLFGFSRGAYTVRCLAAVIAFCGIPTRMKDGSPLRLTESASKKIAREAVKRVYQHTSSWKKTELTTRQDEMLKQRQELARRFRNDYASGDDEKANVYPHFIGVFDTVASLVNPTALALFIAIGAAGILAVGAAGWWLLGPIWIFTAWWHFPALLLALAAVVGLGANLVLRVKWEIGLPYAKWWRPFHLAEARMNFYDRSLNPNVGYARHAISIDETRDSFRREPWGDREGPRRDTGHNEHGQKNPPWLVQLWFAGNHSDIGGSYAENESRLSDITLSWMLGAAESVGLKCDRSVLHLFPDPTGPQHDETRAGVFKIASSSPRKIGPDYPLHASVLARFAAPEVLQYDVRRPYRPESLRKHDKVKHLY